MVIFEVEDQIEGRRDALTDALEQRLNQKSNVHLLFRLRWTLVRAAMLENFARSMRISTGNTRMMRKMSGYRMLDDWSVLFPQIKSFSGHLSDFPSKTRSKPGDHREPA